MRVAVAVLTAVAVTAVVASATAMAAATATATTTTAAAATAATATQVAITEGAAAGQYVRDLSEAVAMDLRVGRSTFLQLMLCLKAAGALDIDSEAIIPILRKVQVHYRCSDSPCKNGAFCRSFTQGVKCLCTEGWTGSFCDRRYNCSDCKNGASCIVYRERMSECVCPTTHTGYYCETLISINLDEMRRDENTNKTSSNTSTYGIASKALVAVINTTRSAKDHNATGETRETPGTIVAIAAVTGVAIAGVVITAAVATGAAAAAATGTATATATAPTAAAANATTAAAAGASDSDILEPAKVARVTLVAGAIRKVCQNMRRKKARKGETTKLLNIRK
ncbi:hypothetical protein LSAT2_011268 [Lamellibrachia satsuma]|nr:hypothetical protein LSAT2_011268 [Lamellibrachia satsuma]